MDKNERALEGLKESIKELKESTVLVPDSLADVGFEAMEHLMGHFKIPEPTPEEKDRDFCLCFFNAYAGIDIAESDGAYATAIYYNGNLDCMAHLLAHMMRKDPKIHHLIYHALHAYQQGV